MASRSASSRPPTEREIALPEAFRPLFVPSRYKAFYGGRGSGKSHAVATALVLMAAERPLRILAAREIQRSIRDSSKRLLDDRIAALGLEAAVPLDRRGHPGPQRLAVPLRRAALEPGIDQVHGGDRHRLGRGGRDRVAALARHPGADDPQARFGTLVHLEPAPSLRPGRRHVPPRTAASRRHPGPGGLRRQSVVPRRARGRAAVGPGAGSREIRPCLGGRLPAPRRDAGVPSLAHRQPRGARGRAALLRRRLGLRGRPDRAGALLPLRRHALHRPRGLSGRLPHRRDGSAAAQRRGDAWRGPGPSRATAPGRN